MFPLKSVCLPQWETTLDQLITSLLITMKRSFFVSTISFKVMSASSELKLKVLCDFTRSWIWSVTKTSFCPATGIQFLSWGPYNLIAKYHLICYTSSPTLWCLEPPPPKMSARMALYLFDISELGWSSKARKKKKKLKEKNFLFELHFWFNYSPGQKLRLISSHPNGPFLLSFCSPCPCTCYIDI